MALTLARSTYSIFFATGRECLVVFPSIQKLFSTTAGHKSIHKDPADITVTSKSNKEILTDRYNHVKYLTECRPLPENCNPDAIYANNELKLDDIDVYGFDYDYTVAAYKETLDKLIYDMGKNVLVSEYKYPASIQSPEYAFHPHFAERGLHCDVLKGFLLKIDAYHNIQSDSVYRGMRKVSDEEVYKTYNGFHLSAEMLSGFYGTGARMHQLMDLFSVPEMTLYANINEYFLNNEIDYDPENVFYDVRHAIRGVHKSGQLHRLIQENMPLYLNKDDRMRQFMVRLHNGGKKMFLITNSTINIVDKGMNFLIGNDWLEFFDVVVTKASKPKFFSDSLRHFRKYNQNLEILTWNKVTKFEKGSVYQGGNFYELIKLTGWSGHNVLYMGDHVYADLADATLKLGWRTGAIIPELEQEINVMNSKEYKKAIIWSIALEHLIDEMQVYEDAESKEILDKWIEERGSLRKITRSMFNPRFGSIFRTYHNATYFSSRFKRFADVYTGSLVNFLNYSLSHTFYPKRSALPHELRLDYFGSDSFI